MKTLFHLFPVFLAAGAFAQDGAQKPDATAPVDLPPVVVRDNRARLASDTRFQPAAAQKARAQDGAALLEGTPGVAIVRNGPQTGIVQMRGLGGDRVKIAVDGMTVTPACPNHMDPPLHYAAPASIETLSIMAGVTPVSQGGDSIAGTLLAQPRALTFAPAGQTLFGGELGAQYRGSNDGYGFNGAAHAADERVGADYQGSWQTADDLRFPGGRVRDTGYTSQQHAVRTGLRSDGGLLTLDLGLTSTRDSGTPALPMDMIEDDSKRLGLAYQGTGPAVDLDARLYLHTIDHLMDNHSLRPLPPTMMSMSSPAESDDTGLELGLSMPRDGDTLRFGGGFHHNEFDAYQRNDMTGKTQDTLNDASRLRAGAYLEWQGAWTPRWTSLLGVRNDTVRSDASDIESSFPMSAADRARFNALDHEETDSNWDASAALRFTPDAASRYELAVARKNRAPALLERYLWTPLSASAGMADGRTYLGNPDLDSETSHQISATAGWTGEGWELSLTPFYNRVDDYILGSPSDRLDANGKPVLQFENIDRADLYGIDAATTVDLTDHLALRAVLSQVRGTNEDTGDDLYRIAPLRGMLALDHEARGFQNSAEWVVADRQDRVAEVNGETPTAGYGLLHLRSAYTFADGLLVGVALENVFDKRYADHLGGVNRVMQSDVPVGGRIPGAGRFLSVSVNCPF